MMQLKRLDPGRFTVPQSLHVHISASIHAQYSAPVDRMHHTHTQTSQHLKETLKTSKKL